MTAGDIAAYLDGLYPQQTAEDFDNVGLLVGDFSHTVNKVMVMLDADDNTVCEAIKSKTDMIVTHHPLIFSPIKRVNDKRILSLVKNGVALYSAHTNLDSGIGGVNDSLSELLCLKNANRVCMPDTDFYAVCGETETKRLSDFIMLVKEKLGISCLRYTGDNEKTITKVGVVGGCGTDFIEAMKNLGCDAFVTADLKYHQAQFAESLGISVIDAGHFETENHICRRVAELLKNRFPDIEVLVSKRKTSYIKYG